MGRVLVAGSINMDIAVVGDRLPGVGETVVGRSLERFPGGKGANQAVAAARAGAEAEMVGVLGSDEAGAELREFLSGSGVGVAYLRSSEQAATGTAIVLVADGDNAIVVVPGANAELSATDVERVAVEPRDVLVSQFEIGEEAIEAFFERGRAAGARTVLNPSPSRPCSPRLWELSDVIVLNELEAGHMNRAAELAVREDQALVVTLGERGCLVASRGERTAIAGHAVDVVDTTGAGDCFVGAMAARLVAGAELVAAATSANAAASLCVQRMGAGTSMPSADEIAAALR